MSFILWRVSFLECLSAQNLLRWRYLPLSVSFYAMMKDSV
jgi:hypothetical protein